jgi:hypothetical protein
MAADELKAAAERLRRYGQWYRNHYQPPEGDPYRRPDGLHDLDQRWEDVFAVVDAYLAGPALTPVP